MLQETASAVDFSIDREPSFSGAAHGHTHRHTHGHTQNGVRGVRYADERGRGGQDATDAAEADDAPHGAASGELGYAHVPVAWGAPASPQQRGRVAAPLQQQLRAQVHTIYDALGRQAEDLLGQWFEEDTAHSRGERATPRVLAPFPNSYPDNGYPNTGVAALDARSVYLPSAYSPSGYSGYPRPGYAAPHSARSGYGGSGNSPGYSGNSPPAPSSGHLGRGDAVQRGHGKKDSSAALAQEALYASLGGQPAWYHSRNGHSYAVRSARVDAVHDLHDLHDGLVDPAAECLDTLVQLGLAPQTAGAWLGDASVAGECDGLDDVACEYDYWLETVNYALLDAGCHSAQGELHAGLQRQSNDAAQPQRSAFNFSQALDLPYLPVG